MTDQNTEIPGFERDLRNLINCYSMENGSDTPDYILARYLLDCLAAFDAAVKVRSNWYVYKADWPNTTL